MRESRDMIYLDFDWLKVDEVYFLFFFLEWRRIRCWIRYITREILYY